MINLKSYLLSAIALVAIAMVLHHGPGSANASADQTLTHDEIHEEWLGANHLRLTVGERSIELPMVALSDHFCRRVSGGFQRYCE